MVKVPPCTSAGSSFPARARLVRAPRRRAGSGGGAAREVAQAAWGLREVELLGPVDHRHDQPAAFERGRDADVQVLEELEPVLVPARIGRGDGTDRKSV